MSRRLATLATLWAVMLVGCSGSDGVDTERPGLSLASEPVTTSLATTTTEGAGSVCPAVARFEDWTNTAYEVMSTLRVDDIEDLDDKNSAFLGWQSAYGDRIERHLGRLEPIIDDVAALDADRINGAEDVLVYLVTTRNILWMFTAATDIGQVTSGTLDDVNEFRAYQVVLERCEASG